MSWICSFEHVLGSHKTVMRPVFTVKLLGLWHSGVINKLTSDIKINVLFVRQKSVEVWSFVLYSQNVILQSLTSNFFKPFLFEKQTKKSVSASHHAMSL